MKLVHFAREPFAGELEPREQRVEAYRKPNGLWLSDEDEYGWSQWCTDEVDWPDRLAYGYAVTIGDNAKVLHLATEESLDAFTEDYGDHEDRFGAYSGRRFVDHIRWADVAKEWQGILITPYQSSRRLAPLTSWYYTWDCASGCIWDPAAIASIEAVAR